MRPLQSGKQSADAVARLLASTGAAGGSMDHSHQRPPTMASMQLPHMPAQLAMTVDELENATAAPHPHAN